MSRRIVVLGALLVVWLLVMGLVAKSALDRLSAPPWGNPSGNATTLLLGDGVRVGQTFTAPLPGLHRIDLLVDVQTAGPAQLIAFHLQPDAPGAGDLWSTTLSLGENSGRQPVIVEFPPIRDSKGRSYHVYLEAAEGPEGEPIAVVSAPAEMLPGAHATLNGEPAPGALWFQSYYSLRTREKVDLLLSRMAEGRPYLLGAKGFYVGLGVAYVLALGALTLSIVLSILKEREGSL